MTATIKDTSAIFLHIAEMNGYREGSTESKIKYGMCMWSENRIHEPNLETEKGRSELHECMWLQRHYKQLDEFFQIKPFTLANIYKRRIGRGDYSALQLLVPRTDYQWPVPVELDASASMLQYMGLLLGDVRLTNMTNVTGDRLSDPWASGSMSRTMFKHAATPLLYGSSQLCSKLWQDKGHAFTWEQVVAFNNELKDGALGIANQLKEFIIHNCNPEPVMALTVWNETFRVECNRYKHKGETTKAYRFYDSRRDLNETILHTSTVKVPDLEQFRRFFVTALVHNLDSQVADRVTSKLMDKYNWGISIHDAFLCSPSAADDVRSWYAEELMAIYTNRKQILTDYFRSIGITQAALGQWNQLMAKVHPLPETFTINAMALK